MTIWQSLVIGIVEGATEFLPVSSTGHIILAQRIMGIRESEAADAFAIVVQFGAIVAIAGLYYHRIIEMIRGFLGQNRAGLTLAINILVAFFPAVVIGLTLEKKIKAALFNLPAIAAAWFVGGVAILLIGAWRRKSAGGAQAGATSGNDITQLTARQAIVIGLVQCLAMWPGTSRSLVTIVGGLIVGLSVPAAVEFSFLLGLLTLTGACAHDVLKHHHALTENYSVPTMAVGFLGAAVAAALTVQWLVGYLRSHGLAIFGWYRVGLAVIVGVLLAFGVLDAKVSRPEPATPPSAATTPSH